MTGKSRHNQDNIIIESLARGENQVATAKLSGCSVSTIRRRLDDPEIRARVESYRASMLDSAAGKLGAVIVKAIATLERLLSEENPPAVQMAAARSVLEYALKTREVLSWEKRLTEVEVSMKIHSNVANDAQNSAA